MPSSADVFGDQVVVTTPQLQSSMAGDLDVVSGKRSRGTRGQGRRAIRGSQPLVDTEVMQTTEAANESQHLAQSHSRWQSTTKDSPVIHQLPKGALDLDPDLTLVEVTRILGTT